MKFFDKDTGTYKSIINTTEILTGEGKNLNDILVLQSQDISKLKSNVKWIYQYGGTGTGSGSGSGSGSSSSWTIYATLNNQQITSGGSIVMEQPGSYKLYVSISNPGGLSSFNLSYSYTTSTGLHTLSNIALTTENGYEYSTVVSLDENESMTITIADTYMVRKGYTFSYNVYPYVIDDSVTAYSDDSTKKDIIEGGDIYLTSVNSTGLYFGVNYRMVSKCSLLEYKWSTNNTTLDNIISQLDTDDNKISGTLVEPLTGTIKFYIPAEYLTADIAGSYKVSLDISVQLEGYNLSKLATRSVSFNLIPQTFYIKVEPTSGELYTTSQYIGDPKDNVLPDSVANNQYTPGSINFKVSWYEGQQKSTTEMFAILLDNEVYDSTQSTTFSVKDRTVSVNSKIVSDSGEHKIRIKPLNRIASEAVYYFYVKQLSNSINSWFDTTNSTNIIMSEYYRPDGIGTTTDGTNITPNIFAGTTYTQSSTIKLTPSSDTLTYDLAIGDVSSTTVQNCHISFGFTYSKVNDDTEAIFGIKAKQSSDICTIMVYRDHFTYLLNQESATSCNIYIPTTTDYDPNIVTEGYHMIDLVWRQISGNDSNAHYEFVVYIDGVLDGNMSGLLTTAFFPYQLNVYNVNVAVNLMEVSHYKNTYTFTDWDIARHWYKYKTVLGHEVSENLFTLIDVYKNFELTGQDVKVLDLAAINNVVKNVNIPVLYFATNDSILSSSNSTVYKWLTSSYTENGKPDAITCDVYYARDIDDSLSQIKSSGTDINEHSYSANWTIQPQGSSTLSYRTKNFTLALEIANGNEDGRVPLFTPNFNPTNPTGTGSYYPEQSWTLKADVVDSSHSNNNACGAFVNTVMQTYNMGTAGKAPRNCLTGFPVLIFLSIKHGTADTDETDYYFLGIYNFNLGRDSKYNLGHTNVKAISSLYTAPLTSVETGSYRISNGTSIITVSQEENQYMDNFVIAEITGNNAYFDFSQYDSTILFPLPKLGNNDKLMMFDDIKTKMNAATYQSVILKFVEYVAKAGGYCFNYIGKTFRESYEEKYNGVDKVVDEDGTITYYPNNTVPDFRNQWIRDDKDSVATYKLGSVIDDATAFSSNTLFNFTLSTDNSNFNATASADNQIPLLDMQSAVEYYTICMALGLVDSVQKNLNIKTWDGGKTWYIAFYDMDTCLGVNNEGADVNYFAFSDYWYGDSVYDATGTNVTPGTIFVYRDYAPDGDAKPANYSGYDTPSNYLFAIVKYASICAGTNDSNNDYYTGELYPAACWAKLRSSSGALSSADSFIENFYAHHMEAVDEFIWNLNYRAKYFIQTNPESIGSYVSNNSYDTNNVNKFNGRRIEKVRNWLSGRVRLLDAYFNLAHTNNAIQAYDPETHTWDYYTKGGLTIYETKISNTLLNDVKNNSDVTLWRDIFSEGTQGKQYSSININAKIKALAYSPLIVETSNAVLGRYLLEEGGNTLYNIKIKTDGNQYLWLHGSSTWTYIDNISSFITNGDNYIISDYLQTIYADACQGTATKWTLDIPNIRYITLNNSKATGSISNISTKTIYNADGSMYTTSYDAMTNLLSVDIKNSGISLTLTDSNVKEVNAENINATSLSLTGNKILTNLTMTTATLNTLTLSPIPDSLYKSNKTLTVPTTWKIKKLELTGSGTADTDDYVLSISNNSTIQELNVWGFNKITIHNCPNLKYVKFTNSADSLGTLKTLWITDSGANLVRKTDDAVATAGIYVGPNIEDTSTLGMIYLRDYYNLKSVCFGATAGFDRCVLPGALMDSTKSPWNTSWFGESSAVTVNIDDSTTITANCAYGDPEKNKTGISTYDTTVAALKGLYDQELKHVALITQTLTSKSNQTYTYGAFRATNVKYIDTYAPNGETASGTVDLSYPRMVIAGSYTFSECTNLLYTLSDASTLHKYSYLFNITNFNCLFYLSSGKSTAVDTDFAKYVLTAINNTNKWVITKNNATKLSITNVTSLEQMFRNQQAISYTVDDKTCPIDMSAFVNATSLWYMLGGTNINRLSKSMLSYGKSKTSFSFSDLIGQRTNPYVDMDAFQYKYSDGTYFILKLTSITFYSASSYGSVLIIPVKNNAKVDTTTVIKPADFFVWTVNNTGISPTLCTLFGGFDIHSDYALNVEKMFEAWPKILELKYVFVAHAHANGVYGLSTLFNATNNSNYPKKWTSITSTAYFSKVYDNSPDITDSTDFETNVANKTLSTIKASHVDLLNLFNWSQIAKTTTSDTMLGVFRYYDTYQSAYEFNFLKKISTVEAFNNILNTILGPSSNLRTIMRIFRYTKIIDSSNGSEEVDPLKSSKMIKIMNDGVTNTKVVSLHVFLTNVELYTADPDTSDSYETLPLNVDPNICKKFPNCLEYDNMFYGCWLLRTPGFDYFGRRTKTETTVYIDTETYEVQTDYDGGISVMNTYYKHPKAVKLVKYAYTNGKPVTNVSSIFRDCKFGNGYNGDTIVENQVKDITNAPCFNLKQFFDEYGISNSSNFYGYNTFNEYYVNKIKGQKFTLFDLLHTIGTHLEVDGNILYAVPATEDELNEKKAGTSTAIWADDTNIVVEYPNSRITSYDQLYLNYWSEISSSWDTAKAGMQTASMSYEISDMLDVETNYSEIFITADGSAGDLSNWYINPCCENQLFISPDFFKGMTNDTRHVTNVFYAGGLTSSDDITKTLTGAIPRHLFTLSNPKSLTGSDGIFYNLNILPQFADDITGYTKTNGATVKSEKVYTYYPSGLFSFHSGTLNLAFKSKLFMPPALVKGKYNSTDPVTTMDITWYVFFINDTLSKNITSLSNNTGTSAFPESGYASGKFSVKSGIIDRPCGRYDNTYSSYYSYKETRPKVFINAMYNPDAISDDDKFGFDQSKFSYNLGYLFGPSLLNFYYGNMFTSSSNVTNITKRDGVITAKFAGTRYNDISQWLIFPDNFIPSSNTTIFLFNTYDTNKHCTINKQTNFNKESTYNTFAEYYNTSTPNNITLNIVESYT